MGAFTPGALQICELGYNSTSAITTFNSPGPATPSARALPLRGCATNTGNNASFALLHAALSPVFMACPCYRRETRDGEQSVLRTTIHLLAPRRGRARAAMRHSPGGALPPPHSTISAGAPGIAGRFLVGGSPLHIPSCAHWGGRQLGTTTMISIDPCACHGVVMAHIERHRCFYCLPWVFRY